MKRCLVTGGCGFIGAHLVARLKAEGHWVQAVDRRPYPYGKLDADVVTIHDLRRDMPPGWFAVDEVYQLAADMGGAGYVFTGDNDARIMHNSTHVNFNVLHYCQREKPDRVFFSSSACVYPNLENIGAHQAIHFAGGRYESHTITGCREQDAYPANPDSNYGWEKLYAERLYEAYARNYNLTVRIGRFHNVYGPFGTWRGGREKAPAAICRKVAEAPDGGTIEIWGDGTQQRSFMYIDDALDGMTRLMRSSWPGPLNLGSSEMVDIDDLVDIVAGIADKELLIRHVEGPVGVQGRNSDNTLVREKLGWEPTVKLVDGLSETYRWIAEQVRLDTVTPVV